MMLTTHHHLAPRLRKSGAKPLLPLLAMPSLCGQEQIYRAYCRLVHAVAQLVEELRYKSEFRRFDSPMVSLEFFIDNPSGRTMAPGVDSASNRNEYQEYFLGLKAAGA